MGLDINKIIMESIQEMQQIDNNSTVLTESNTTTNSNTTNNNTTNNRNITYEQIFESATATSLAAGLGAIVLRDQIRRVNGTLTENEWLDAAGEFVKKTGRAVSDGALSGLKGIGKGAGKMVGSTLDDAQALKAGVGAVGLTGAGLVGGELLARKRYAQ